MQSFRTAQMNSSTTSSPESSASYCANRAAQPSCSTFHWREFCHFADALSPSPLIHLLKGEGGSALHLAGGRRDELIDQGFEEPPGPRPVLPAGASCGARREHGLAHSCSRDYP